MTVYKFRAECARDVSEFLKVVDFDKVHMEKTDLSGIEVTFTSAWSLENIVYHLASIEDGHVMAATVALFVDYTGERKF